jgi:hypothetical protein
MKLEQAVSAIRSLDLPQQRRVELIRRVVSAPTTGTWFVIVSQARLEVETNAQANRQAINQAFDDRRQRSALSGSQTPRKAPSKLTSDHRQQVREMRADGATLREIAERFDVAESTIFRALEGAPEEKPVVPAKLLKPWTPKPLAADDERHGTNSGYANFGCRCSRCAEARREYRSHRKSNPKPRAKTSDHGTEPRYSRGCRCAECKAAKGAANRKRKKDRADVGREQS